MPFLTSVYWLRDQTYDRVRRVFLAVLRAGPIPQHVAFVMDGNRRYARVKGMKVIQGHVDGFVALRRVRRTRVPIGKRKRRLSPQLDSGNMFWPDIKFVSVYAFAIDNFKRPKEEVDGLMHLAENALLDLCTHGGLLAQHGIRLNTVGKTNLFPPRMTKNNHKAVLNLCMPYSSRDEIATAVEETIHVAVSEGRTEPITEKDIEDHLMTTKVNSPPLDILIRTSGVKRLSDFLLWQCTDNTQIHFIDTFWPDMGLFDLLPIMLDYQRKIWSQ
ncbi:Decaprenyl diphosphate synthase-like protein [Lactarius quietus]|nr:Decaprenyl diphosphate synthase-like protein [Lactarius quietus]